MENRKQALPLFTAIAMLIGAMVIVQLWLLSVSVSAVLARDAKSAIPAAIASAVLLALNAGLLLYVRTYDRRLRAMRD